MQLDLFLDNERTIRLNLAHEALANLDFARAIREYGLILKKNPGDAGIRREEENAAAWAERIERYRTAPTSPDRLHRLFLEMAPDLCPSLHRGLLRFFIDELRKEARPERIFHKPAFHLGDLYMALGDYTEAERWFAKTLDAGIPERGRFLARRGDALTAMEDPGRAREHYLFAFLEDPEGVNLDALADRAIISLIEDLEMEGHEKEGILSVLPIFGWLRGLFVLPRIEAGMDPASDLARMEGDPEIDSSRLWFEYLRCAEYLRTRRRDDREMIRTRRKMKQLAPEWFEEYMRKLGMAAQSFRHRE